MGSWTEQFSLLEYNVKIRTLLHRGVIVATKRSDYLTQCQIVAMVAPESSQPDRNTPPWESRRGFTFLLLHVLLAIADNDALVVLVHYLTCEVVDLGIAKSVGCERSNSCFIAAFLHEIDGSDNNQSTGVQPVQLRLRPCRRMAFRGW